MTFTEIRDRIATRFNLTSAEALSRIEDEINEVYLEVVTSVGMVTSTRTEATAEAADGSRYVTFGDSEAGDVLKVITVKDANVNTTNPRILEEIEADEMVEESLISWPPTKYCIYRVGPGSVIVKFNAECDTDNDGYEFTAEVEESTTELTDDDEPQFPRNFHDVLIKGVMIIEADKKEKPERLVKFEQRFERRMGDLRYFLATSAHRRFWQGKRPRRR